MQLTVPSIGSCMKSKEKDAGALGLKNVVKGKLQAIRATTTHQGLGLLLGQNQPDPMLGIELMSGLLGHFQNCWKLTALIKVMGQAQSPGKVEDNCLLMLRGLVQILVTQIKQWDPVDN